MYRKLTPLTECLLCGENKPLLKSHVVPNFFRKWLAKELGEAPRFQNPNTRVGRYHDDLSKHQLCCLDCEGMMSRDESTARKQMLIEWKRDDAHVCAYGPWLARFAAGLCAKAVAVQLYSPPTTKTRADEELPFNRLMEDSIPLHERERLAKALEAWRLFVLGKSTNPGRHELHLLGANLDQLPGLRGVFGHSNIRSRNCSGVVIWLNGIVVVGVVQGGSDLVRRSTRVAVRQGAVGAHNYDITPMTAEMLIQMSDANVATWAVERRLRDTKR